MTNLSEITFFLSKALRFDLNATLELKPLILNKVHLINSLRPENKTFFLQTGITSLPAITLNPIPNKDLRLSFSIKQSYSVPNRCLLSNKGGIIMNPQKVLSILAINKPISYSEFIRLAIEGRVNEASFKRAECTPLYCYIVLESILLGLQLTQSIVDKAFAEDPGIIELEEVSTFIRDNYAPLKARIMLGSKYND